MSETRRFAQGLKRKTSIIAESTVSSRMSITPATFQSVGYFYSISLIASKLIFFLIYFSGKTSNSVFTYSDYFNFFLLKTLSGLNTKKNMLVFS